jgi:hypothetical protein
MVKFKITWQEWVFVAIMTILAIIFTNKYWLLLLNKFNPVIGFLIYYAVVYVALILMSYAGLIVFGVKIKNPLQILGSGLILFAFFMIFNWSNDYANIIGAEKVLINSSEDGLIWFLWSSLIHPTDSNLWIIWALAFPLTVFIITLIGVLLIHKKPKLTS